MKSDEKPESSEGQPTAALFTLLRTIDPESLLPYTAVREVEAMAGARVFEAVEALRTETQAEFKALRAETKALRAETKALHVETLAEFKGMLAETRAEFKALRAETQGELREMRVETQGELREMRAETQGELREMRAETQGEFKAIKAAIASNAAAIGANAREIRNLLVSQSEVTGELRASGRTYKQLLWVLIGFLVTTLTSALVALYVQAFGS